MFKTRRQIGIYFGLITLAKILMAVFFPITGDEAYFYQWGKYPDMVYYDHPPLLGWWMSLAAKMGSSILWPRLLSISVGLITAYGLYRWVQQDGVGGLKSTENKKQKGLLLALLYYAAPLNFLWFFVSTDTPMMLFVFLSGYFFLVHLKSRSPWSLVWGSALCLGLAFWSKYLMAFMAFGLVASLFVMIKETRERFKVLAVFVTVGLLFVAYHVYWSSQNCWWSLQFNLWNRRTETQFRWSHVLTYLLYQVYLIQPWILYRLAKDYKTVKNQIGIPQRSSWILFITPIVLMIIPSAQEPNLHWTLAYMPFLFMSLMVFDESTLAQLIPWNLGFTMVHALVLGGLILCPDIWFKDNKFYADIIMGKYGKEIEEELFKKGYKDNYEFGTLGYTTAGLMEYHTGRHYFVFKDIDANGRSDDKWTDYRVLNSKNLLLISTYKYRPNELKDYSAFFDRVEYEDLYIRGAHFYIARGIGFRFENYRKEYLLGVKAQFYTPPSFFPEGRCFFDQRYGQTSFY